MTVRFTKRRGQSEWLRFFRRIAKSHGLIPSDITRERRSCWSRTSLADAESMIFFTRQLRSEARRDGLIPLPDAKVLRMCRPVWVNSITAANRDVLTVTFEFCDRNEYPAVYHGVWTKRRPYFPAGMISIAGKESSVVEYIRDRCLYFKYGRAKVHKLRSKFSR